MADDLDYTDEAALKKMQASRIAEALNNHPYLRRMYESITLVEATDCPSPMAIDEYWRVYYNPELLHKYPDDTLPTMLYHEIMHPMRKHSARGKVMYETDNDLHPDLLGLAANFEINDDIVDEQKEGNTNRNGKPRVNYPKDIQLPSMFKLPNGLLFEQYAQLLVDLLPPPPPGGGGGEGEEGEGGGQGKGPGSGEGSGAHGKHRPWEKDAPTKENGQPGVSKSRQGLILKDVAQKILDEAAKGRGTIPAHLELAAKEIINPHIPWERILGPMVRQSINMSPGMEEDTFSRSHRRQDWEEEWIKPGTQNPVPNIAVVADTSGSMLSGDELACVLGTIDSLLKTIGGEVTVIPCDSKVAKGAVQKVFNAVRTKLFGGGGTDMGVGIAAAEGLKPLPSVCIVATDGETPYPDKKPKIPVVICLIGEGSRHYKIPSWAKVIKIDPSQLKTNRK